MTNEEPQPPSSPDVSSRSTRVNAAAMDGSGRWRNPGWRVLALAAAVGIAMGLIGIAIVLLNVSPPQGGRPDGVGVAGFVVFLILVVPLEEWLTRGVLLQRHIKPLGAVGALLVSSAVFAFLHRWGFRLGFSDSLAAWCSADFICARGRYGRRWLCITCTT